MFRVDADFALIQMRRWSNNEKKFVDQSLAGTTIPDGFCNDTDIVIYVRSDALHWFEQTFNIIFHDFKGVFVIDPMDMELWEKPEWIGPKAEWASPHIPNPFESSGLCIPVGVEELSLNRNGKISNLKFQPIKNKLVLVGPFAATHQRRSEFVGWLGNSIIDVVSNRLKPKAYARLASDYKFVVCPRGNGIDTHRFWETLYRGSIPIVESSDWAKYFQSHGIPMIVVKSFGELLSWKESDFSSIWQEQTKTPSEIEALWPEYWLKKIRSFKG